MVRGLIVEVGGAKVVRDVELLGLVVLLIRALTAWLHNDSCATQARELSNL